VRYQPVVRLGLHFKQRYRDISPQLSSRSFALFSEGKQHQRDTEEAKGRPDDPRDAEISRPNGRGPLGFEIAIIVLGLVSGIIYIGLAFSASRRREWSAAAFFIFIAALGGGISCLLGELLIGNLATVGVEYHPRCGAYGDCGNDR
jgi:hypothetical protein